MSGFDEYERELSRMTQVERKSICKPTKAGSTTQSAVAALPGNTQSAQVDVPEVSPTLSLVSCFWSHRTLNKLRFTRPMGPLSSSGPRDVSNAHVTLSEKR